METTLTDIIDLLNIILGSFIVSFGKCVDFWFRSDKKKEVK